MTKLGTKILKLRSEGKTYTEIQKIVGGSKATISYHCGENQKEKLRKRTQKLRKENPLLGKVDWFKNPSYKNKKRVSYFKRRSGDKDFNYKDFLEKVGENPKCYLTGRDIDLADASSYQLDHIIPKVKGGKNTLDNLGLATTAANQAKNVLTHDEFIQLCVDVVRHNGYCCEA